MAEVATGIRSDTDVMDGEPVVAGTRVRVATLHRAVEEHGVAPETVATRYGVSKADVHRSLAYYHDHADEMARHERRREELKARSIEDGARTLSDFRREHGDA